MVRRVALQWLNPSFTELWTAVETYESVPLNAILHRQGNAALSRKPVAKNVNTSQPLVIGLPRNWYNND